MSAQFAVEHLAEHVPAGPVRDLMFQGCEHPARSSVAPSDDVAWQLYTSMSAADAALFIGSITSPALLEKIAARERRVAPRRQLARNPHLPYPVLQRMAAAAGSDREFGRLVAGLDRDASEVMQLLFDYPDLALFDRGETIGTCAARSVAAGPIRTVLAGGVPLEIWHLVSALLACSDEYRNRLEEPVRLEIADAYSQVDAQLEGPRLAALLLPGSASIEHQRACLARCGVREVRLRLLDMLTAGERVVPLVEILEGARGEDLLALADRLAHVNVPVDVDAARVLDDPSLPGHMFKLMGLTDEARALLTASKHELVALSVTLGQCDFDAQVALLNARVEMVRGHLDELWYLLDVVALAEAGLCDELLVAFITRGPRRDLPQDVEARVARLAPDELLIEVDWLAAQADVIAARPDVSDLTETASLLLDGASGRLETRVRRSFATALTGDLLLRWLIMDAGRVNRPQPGDWTWLAKHSPRRAELLRQSETVVLRYAEPSWISEAVPVLPLPWGEVRSSAAFKVATERFTALLGTDEAAWKTVIALLPDWVGTPDDLAGTVLSITR